MSAMSKGGTPYKALQKAMIGGEEYFVATADQAQAAGGRTWVTDLVPSQRADPSQEFEVPLSDWSQGAGFSFAGLDGAYDRANGWDASTPGKPATWPQRATGESLTTADYKGWQFQLGNYLYVCRGRFVAKYAIDDTAGATWPVIEVHDLGSGIVVAGRPAIFKGKAYVPRRSGAGGTTELFHELTTVNTTVVETQTIVISGTPTSGTYTISFDGKTTSALAFNASGADVQAALRALAGLERVTVVTTGTTPNFTHTVTMTAVGGDDGNASPPQMTSTDSTSGGTHAIAHNTTVAGTTDVWTAGDADVAARCFTLWQNKLALANDNYIRTCSGNPLTEGDWFPDVGGVGYEVGDSGREITDLSTYGTLLIIGKVDGLWSFNESLATVNEIRSLQSVVDSDNCIGMEEHDGYLLVPHKTGLIQWAPGEYRFVGAEQEGALEGDISRGWGRTTSVAPYGKYGYLAVNDALDTSAAVLSLQPPLGTQKRAPVVPHMHHEHTDASLEHAIILQSTAQPASPHYPSTWSDDNAVGANAWQGPDAAADDDDLAAYVQTTGQTHYLKGLNPGPGIPDDATIQGVMVEVKRKVTPSSPSYVSSSIAGSGSSTSTSVVVSKPSGTTDGHLIVVTIAAAFGQPQVTPPPGWIQAGTTFGQALQAGVIHVYYKIASSEGSSWTWTLGTAAIWTAVAATYSGVDTFMPIDPFGSTFTNVANAGNAWAASYGTTRPNSLLASFATPYFGASDQDLASQPAGFTSRASNTAGGSGSVRTQTWLAELAIPDITPAGTTVWPGDTGSAGIQGGIANIVINGAHVAADTTLKLVKGGSVAGSNKATADQWPTTFAYANYGGSLDLWGTTLTPADVNASNFGVVLSATLTTGAELRVDTIRMTVYYSVPGVADVPSLLSVLHVAADRTTATPKVYTLPRAGLTIANDPNVDRAIANARISSSRFYQPSRNVQKTWRNVEFWLDATPEANTPGVQLWASIDEGTAFQLLDAAGNAATFRTTGFHQAYFPMTAAAVGRYVQIQAYVPATAGSEVPVAVSFRDMVLHGTADPLMTEEVSNVVLVLGGGEFEDRTSMRRSVAQQIADLSALAAPTTAPVPYRSPVTPNETGYLKVTHVRFREVIFKGAEESTMVALVNLRKVA